MKVPCIITENDPIIVSMIENLMREDLHPVDEAKILKALLDKSCLKQNEMVEKFDLSSAEYLSGTL